MTQNDFIVCAPFAMTNRSHGVRTLIELARAIRMTGRHAFLCTYVFLNGRETILPLHPGSYTPHNDVEKDLIDTLLQVERDFDVPFLRNFSPQYLAGCRVVYPETMMTPNPLNAQQVIRYFLNKDGALTGKKVATGPDDFILAYSETLHPHAHHVCFYAGHDLDMFNNDGTVPAEQRRLDLTYVGKGSDFGFSIKVPNTAEITRTWPTTKQQLAMLLRNCRFFYTADAFSKITSEALACGAIPVYLHNGPWSDAEIDGSIFGAVPRLDAHMAMGPNFFLEFEVRRTGFIDRLKTHANNWGVSVQQMIDKTDRHFAQRP